MDPKILRAGLLGSMSILFETLMADLAIPNEKQPSRFIPRHLYEKPPLSKKMAKARAATQRQRAARRQTRLHLK